MTEHPPPYSHEQAEVARNRKRFRALEKLRDAGKWFPATPEILTVAEAFTKQDDHILFRVWWVEGEDGSQLKVGASRLRIVLQNPDGTYHAYTFESLDTGNIASEHTLRPEEPVEVMPRSAWPPEVGAHTDRLDQEAVERLVRSQE